MNSVFTTLMLVGLLTMVLWAGVSLLWKPEEVAPWRVTAVDFAESEAIAKETKREKAQEKAKAKAKAKTKDKDEKTQPARKNEDYLTPQPALGAANTSANGTVIRADPIDDSDDDVDALENALLTADQHQFNVTITYNDAACLGKFGNSVSVKILFNNNTAALKSRSISELDAIVNIYHQCSNQRVTISLPGQNLETIAQGGLLDASSGIAAGNVRPSLRQRREDEVKYFLMHMRIAKERIRLPDQL